MTATVGVWIQLYTEITGEDFDQAERRGLVFAQEIKAKCLEGDVSTDFYSDVELVRMSDDENL